MKKRTQKATRTLSGAEKTPERATSPYLINVTMTPIIPAIIFAFLKNSLLEINLTKFTLHLLNLYNYI